MGKVDEILNAILANYGAYWAGKSHYLPDTKFMKKEEGKEALKALLIEMVGEVKAHDYTREAILKAIEAEFGKTHEGRTGEGA